MYIGVDLGGTNIKVALVNDACEILAEAQRPTGLPRSAEAVCKDIVETMRQVLVLADVDFTSIGGIGVGCPGKVDGEAGMVIYSNNLGWKNFDIRGYLRSATGFDIALANDANVAALGEVCAGSAKGAESAVIITLGTGVGSGVVLGGKIVTGYGRGASEIGHIVIQDGGVRCTCGRYGCLESYASATALIRMTNEAVAQNPQSGLAKLAQQGGVDGKTAFEAAGQGDIAGRQVVDKYIHYLGCGLANIINIFQPEVICLSGGISRQGEALLEPLRRVVYPQVFGGVDQRTARIEICTLGHKAGLIGAAMLVKM